MIKKLDMKASMEEIREKSVELTDTLKKMEEKKERKPLIEINEVIPSYPENIPIKQIRKQIADLHLENKAIAEENLEMDRFDFSLENRQRELAIETIVDFIANEFEMTQKEVKRFNIKYRQDLAKESRKYIIPYNYRVYKLFRTVFHMASEFRTMYLLLGNAKVVDPSLKIQPEIEKLSKKFYGVSNAPYNITPECIAIEKGVNYPETLESLLESPSLNEELTIKDLKEVADKSNKAIEKEVAVRQKDYNKSIAKEKKDREKYIEKMAELFHKKYGVSKKAVTSLAGQEDKQFFNNFWDFNMTVENPRLIFRNVSVMIENFILNQK